MTDPDSISLAAERAAERLRAWGVLASDLGTARRFTADVEALDAARVLLQDYEVAEQDIRDQVAGTIHEQPATLTGPRYLRAVFESLRVQSAKP
jgi:hypothetical protein